MFLHELLKDIDGQPGNSSKNCIISGISSDSRTVEQDNLFVALKGTNQDGSVFINEAIRRGARVIVSNQESSLKHDGVLFLKVHDPQQFLRQAAKRFYAPQSSKVKCIGVTGTNGKTTITYFIESILKEAGKSSGVMGTINYRVGSKVLPSKNTTPGLVENQQFLANLAREGIEYCVMEVSSHGLEQGRVDLIDFKSAIFTNLTSDHLDYHKTRENYFLAKSKLFVGLPVNSTSVINVDDPLGQRLTTMTKSHVLKYGILDKADISAKNIKIDVHGSSFELEALGHKTIVETKLIGLHNIYNILAAVGACVNEDIPMGVIADGIKKLEHVPGRLEQIHSPKGFSVFIDYAHTEDALKNVLESIRKIGCKRIIAVFGCGGDRDKIKRPKMGAVVGKLSDVAIVTTDNPRGEEPQSIVDQIITGFDKNNYQVILDREQAIRQAIELAKPGDIVLIAGKGHEDYQIFKNQTIAFCERQIVEKYLNVNG